MCLSQAGEAGEATVEAAAVRSSPWPRLMEEGQAEWLLEADTPGWEADSFPTKSGDSGCAGLSSSASRVEPPEPGDGCSMEKIPNQCNGLESFPLQCNAASLHESMRPEKTLKTTSLTG